MARARRRTIKGVRLEPGGLLPGESLVKGWPGGELRTVIRRPEIIEGLTVADLPIEEVEWGGGVYAPLGESFALPEWIRVVLEDEAPGLEFEIRVRNGQPCCVAIRSLESGPPITTTLLKSGKLPAIGRLVRETVAERAVRLVRTVEGEVIGILSLSTSDVFASWDERIADVNTAVMDIENSGQRWRMTDEHLKEVAKVYRDAYDRGVPTGREIANHFDTTEQNARRWVARARADGHLPKTEPRKARR
jgi:hypothetical protein